MPRLRVTLTVLGLAVALTGCAVASADPVTFVDRAGGPRCDLPVRAPVIDGFRPPAEKWLAGNRGLTFGTVAGQTVRAVTPGIVTFAGAIADARYVTVRRSDGRDVTYSFLASTDRVTGESVVIGDPVGVTGDESFHLGHREAGAYLDPAPLVVTACGWNRAVLVSVPEGAGTG